MRYLKNWMYGVFLYHCFAEAYPLATQMDELIAKELPHASVGVVIKDAQTGRMLYSKNADTLLAPASSMKVFTAAAALYQLGPNYRFLTNLSQKAGNYYLTFSGSPSLTVANLDQLLQRLKDTHVTTIDGNVVLDLSRFKLPNYPGGTSHDDLGWYYAAPDSAIILNGNALSFDFISGDKIGAPVDIVPKGDLPGLTLINHVKTVSQEQAKEHCDLNIESKAKNTVHLFGCLAQRKDPKTMQLSVPDPVLWAKQLIKQGLQDKGITLKGQILTGYTPIDAKLITSFQSDPLSVLITHMLKHSDNVYANSLTKLLAYVVTGEGSYKQGAYAIKKILSQYTTLDMSLIELSDGMGTRYNLVTPDQMVVLLMDLYKNPDMQSFFLNALPQAGVSGSLQDRMKKTSLEKNVFAKTGTMHDISSLSGYIVNTDGRTLVFSIIINGINTPIRKAKALEEHLLLMANNVFLTT